MHVPAVMHIVTTSRSAYVFLCTNGSSHTYAYATTHTHQTRLCCHYKKLYSSSAGWLTFSQITAGGRPRLMMDLNAFYVYPHTCTCTDRRDGSAAESTQPFYNTSRNFSSSPCMRSRWCGAIKWICCYSSATEAAKDACLLRGTHTHTRSLPCTWSAFMLCNLSNFLGMWGISLVLKRRKKNIYFAVIAM